MLRVKRYTAIPAFVFTLLSTTNADLRDTSAYCKKPIEVSGSLKVQEVLESSQLLVLEVAWILPAGMLPEEKFILKLRDEDGKLVRSPKLSMDNAGCSSTPLCRARVSLEPLSMFLPCSRYDISIKIKGTYLLYCPEPKEMNKIYTTKPRPPSKVTDLSLGNHLDSYWKGQIRWQAPEIASCVEFYRIAYSDLTKANAPLIQGQTPELYYDIKDLRRCSSFHVQVAAVGQNGIQGAIQTQTFATLGCFGVQALAQSGAGAQNQPLSMLGSVLGVILILLLYMTLPLT